MAKLIIINDLEVNQNFYCGNLAVLGGENVNHKRRFFAPNAQIYSQMRKNFNQKRRFSNQTRKSV